MQPKPKITYVYHPFLYGTVFKIAKRKLNLEIDQLLHQWIRFYNFGH